jgi:hypothetical protein
MKPAQSLEEERQALLDQIHNSRDTYRRMLTEAELAQQQGAQRLHGAHTGDRFPRSMTMRWIVGHPYLFGLGVASAALLAPRRVRQSLRSTVRSARPTRSKPIPMQPVPVAVQQVAPPSARSIVGTLLTSLTAIASMLLKDPAKMRMVARAVNSAVDYARQRRGR